ncbi:hydrogenase small subunit [Campylobacter vulpis]|nr:hydrogenase small subunit [Campylobacter vulpis]MBS4331859.1 hydrogenase small subunit [Campylobacter vulpis]MBS4439454.1 hydrogenase small subunit [Campylobacter vulpis]
MDNNALKACLEKRLANLKGGEKGMINEASVATMLKHLGISSELLNLACEYFSLAPKLNVIWLHLAECTGCSESLLRSEKPDLAEFIFEFFSLNYHETLMLANGTKAEECLEKAMKEEFVLIVEGAVAPIDTFYLSIGAEGKSGYELLQSVADKAQIIFAVGTCSSYGGIQAAYPNPTKTCGISQVLSQKVIQIPGCPPSDVNIVATLAFYALFGEAPELDDKNRPKWSYGKCLHDMCERKAKFESGIFAESFDDVAAKNGACLFKVGCKGPYTYNNCPKVKFNAKTSWPVAAGHGCIACSEENFWDDFGFYEKPMANAFAYAKIKRENELILENKNLTLSALKDEINEDELIFYLKESLQILIKKEETLELLNFNFEANLKCALTNLAKNKLGLSLLENYKKSFPKQYAFIEANFDENSKISNDIWEFFDLSYILAKGEFLKDKRHFIEAAQNYAFKHASPYDFKLSVKEDGVKLDLNKSLRMSLIYLCGGLELEGIAFSLLSALAKSLKEIQKNYADKRLILSVDESLNQPFLHQILS